MYEINQRWDMIIAFPPCTHLSRAGGRYFKEKKADGRQEAGIQFVYKIYNAKCDRIAIENPVGILSTRFRKPDQIIQPYYFGDPQSKSTCLWLKNLPRLIPTDIVQREKFITFGNGKKKLGEWFYNTGKVSKKMRAAVRSKTFPGIASAMAEQWTRPVPIQINLNTYEEAK